MPEISETELRRLKAKYSGWVPSHELDGSKKATKPAAKKAAPAAEVESAN